MIPPKTVSFVNVSLLLVIGIALLFSVLKISEPDERMGALEQSIKNPGTKVIPLK